MADQRLNVRRPSEMQLLQTDAKPFQLHNRDRSTGATWHASVDASIHVHGRYMRWILHLLRVNSHRIFHLVAPALHS